MQGAWPLCWWTHRNCHQTIVDVVISCLFQVVDYCCILRYILKVNVQHDNFRMSLVFIHTVASCLSDQTRTKRLEACSTRTSGLPILSLYICPCARCQLHWCGYSTKVSPTSILLPTHSCWIISVASLHAACTLDLVFELLALRACSCANFWPRFLQPLLIYPDTYFFSSAVVHVGRKRMNSQVTPLVFFLPSMYFGSFGWDVSECAWSSVQKWTPYFAMFRWLPLSKLYVSLLKLGFQQL